MQASPVHKDHSQQVRYCGRLPAAAEAASARDSTIILPTCLNCVSPATGTRAGLEATFVFVVFL